MNKCEVFREELNKFETEEIRLYCEDMLNVSPDYIFTIPSSTSYKYHNATQCQPGGQLYHIIMVGEIINYILSLDYIKNKFPEPKKRDCMRVAALLHDMVKCGWDGSQYTVHNHPILAGKWVEETVVEHDIKQGLKNYISSLIQSHSGEWTSSNKSDTVLPAPQDDEHFFIHLSDYLGSRSNLDMIYNDVQKEAIRCFQQLPEPSEMVITFGKHSGKKLGEIDKDYLVWLKNNTELREPLKSAVEALV